MEVGQRVRLETAPLDYATLASSLLVEPAMDVLQFTVTNLVSDTNLFAVEVHQTSTNSSDIVFGLELWGTNTLIQEDHEGHELDPG